MILELFAVNSAHTSITQTPTGITLRYLDKDASLPDVIGYFKRTSF